MDIELETIHGKRKRAQMELLKGKQFAIQLRTLFQNPVRDLIDPASLYDQLTMHILASFSNTISLLSSCPELTQIDTAAHGGVSSCFAESMKPVKDRRGCYKRRKSSNSWTNVSNTKEDGHAWRKYGQKKILNSDNPRCYYRCSHKPQGCKATKQVQKLPEEPFMFHTTYFNNHTCKDHTLRAPHVDPEPAELNLISFSQVGMVSSTPKSNVVTAHQVKEDYSFGMEEEEEAKQDLWKDMLIGPDHCWFGYDGEGGSGFHSCGSTSFSQGLDVEVNQLDDIENVQFDD